MQRPPGLGLGIVIQAERAGRTTPISPLFEPTYISSSLLQKGGSGAAWSYDGPNGLPATRMSDEATYLGNYRKESTSYVLYMS